MINSTIKGGKTKITFSALASGAIAQYRCVYQFTSNSVKTASFSDTTRADVVGLSLSSLIDGQRGKFLVMGELENDLWTWTAGNEIYIDVNGDLTQDLADSGNIITNVGVAISSTKIFFHIDKTIIKTSN